MLQQKSGGRDADISSALPLVLSWALLIVSAERGVESQLRPEVRNGDNTEPFPDCHRSPPAGGAQQPKPRSTRGARQGRGRPTRAGTRPMPASPAPAAAVIRAAISLGVRDHRQVARSRRDGSGPHPLGQGTAPARGRWSGPRSRSRVGARLRPPGRDRRAAANSFSGSAAARQQSARAAGAIEVAGEMRDEGLLRERGIAAVDADPARTGAVREARSEGVEILARVRRPRRDDRPATRPSVQPSLDHRTTPGMPDEHRRGRPADPAHGGSRQHHPRAR